MDVRVYFEKVRQTEAAIAEPHVLVTSLETPDGGKPGTISEVSRNRAARLIVEHRALLSTAGEIAEFRIREDQTRRMLEEEVVSNRVQVSLISNADLRAIKAAKKGK